MALLKTFAFMKKIAPAFAPLLLFMLLFGVTSCGPKTDQHEHEANEDEEQLVQDANAALYDAVMDVHNEVMPKLSTIENKIEELHNQIANTPDMAADKRAEIEALIAKLDAAGQGMRDWMHEFNPPADSLGEDTVRAYLESEMERIKKVKTDMLNALDEAGVQ